MAETLCSYSLFRSLRERIRCVSYGGLIALVFAGILVGAPVNAASTQHVVDSTSVTILDQDIVTIPFQYQNHQILVRGVADGRAGLTFMVDSGASTSVLDSGLRDLGTRAGHTRIREAHGESEVEAEQLQEIALRGNEGTVGLRNVSVVVSDLRQMSRLLGCKLDGIIGIPFLAGFVVEIDYVARVFRFHNKKSLDVTTWTPDNQRTFLFDLTASSHAQDIPCQILQGKLNSMFTYPFLLDTGFGGYVSVAHDAAEHAGLYSADMPSVASTSYGLTRRFQTSKIRAKYLFLGAIDLKGKTVSVDFRNNDEAGQPGIVGNRFLQNYHVILDYPRHKLWLVRLNTTEEPDEAERPALGLEVRAEGNVLRVRRVARFSPAHNSGVHPGDMVLSINGHSLDTLPPSEAMRLLNAPRGVMTLSVEHAIDPNFGTSRGTAVLTLVPASPLDWMED